ncbi:hypothetical protein [Bacillus altitudinis]|uniref:hypothetical protein n=1 Tax=Bacillus altitudinis TaxID=293387 RepID=UPI001643A1F2|nr:hypothetical protein [Bacillus altitudinis]
MYVGKCMGGDSVIGEGNEVGEWRKDSEGFYGVVSDEGSRGIYYLCIEGLGYGVGLEGENVRNLSVDGDE